MIARDVDDVSQPQQEITFFFFPRDLHDTTLDVTVVRHNERNVIPSV